MPGVKRFSGPFWTLAAVRGSRIAREAASIAVGGLLARSRIRYTRSIRSNSAEVLAATAIMWFGVYLAGTVSIFVQDDAYAGQLTAGGWVRVLLPVFVILLAMKRSDRAAGTLGLAWVALDLIHNNPELAVWIDEIPLIVLFAAMTVLPTKTRDGWRPLLWLLPTLLWGFSAVTGRGLTDGVGFFASPLLALGFVGLDPAFAIGAALAWTYLGLGAIGSVPLSLWPWQTFAWISCAPLALLLAIACKQAVKRVSPH
jgi:hypothetical protein